MNKLKYILRFIHFYKNALTIHSIHSPFVFDLVQNVLEDDREFYFFKKAKKIRDSFAKDDTSFTRKDLGAGSQYNNSQKISIKEVARSAISSTSQLQQLFKISHFLNPQSVLELGSSLGLSTLHFYKANSPKKMITIEGDPFLAKRADELFQSENAKIQVWNSSFDAALEKLKTEGPFDLVFIDGNHTYEATMRYYHFFKTKLSEQGCLIFDDIYWSQGMISAWYQIRKDEKFQVALDFFTMGILIKKPKIKERVDIKIIKKRYKPFSLGFWG